MSAPRLPSNEAERLSALFALGVLDTPPEERFDRYTRMARRLFDVPIALVTLVDSERQWFKSRAGTDLCETSRSVSFCTHVVLNDAPMVVPDTMEDPRFAENPLVAGAPDIRFYAGHPLRCAIGLPLGTLCLIDSRPRQFGVEDRRLLSDLARMVEREFASQQNSTTDPLTGLSNRRGFEAVGEHLLRYSNRAELPAVLVYLNLDGFSTINEGYGYAEGDRALVRVAGLLRHNLREADLVARLDKDEFCVLCADTPEENVPHLLERIQRAFERHNALGDAPYPLKYSAIGLRFDGDQHFDAGYLLQDAQRRLDHLRTLRS